MAGRLLRRVAAGLTPAPETQWAFGSVVGVVFTALSGLVVLAVVLVGLAATAGLTVGVFWRCLKWASGGY